MFATDEWIAARTGAHRTTIARWRATRSFPAALVQLAELELHGRVELVHAAWTGFRLDSRDGTLWTPGNWPCRPGDILAIQYRQAQVRALERELAARAAASASPGETFQLRPAANSEVHPRAGGFSVAAV